ncbi:hypothetical protein D3C75_1018140 [compost metagenome]
MAKRKPLKVLFIGPDCSGKSSIAQKVGLHYGISVENHRKLGGTDLFAIEHTIGIVRKMMPSGRSFIWDQFYYPVDVIYERVLGKRPSPLERISWLLGEELTKCDVIVFFVNASEEVLR